MLMKHWDTKDVLDYGAGKRTLEQALGFPIHNYDPCVPGLEKSPESHDIVMCTDVLEHIEPDSLAEVLADIRRCTKRCAFLLISTTPAMKFLADGRNAHLIVEEPQWWRDRLTEAGLEIKSEQASDGGVVVIVE